MKQINYKRLLWIGGAVLLLSFLFENSLFKIPIYPQLRLGLYFELLAVIIVLIAFRPKISFGILIVALTLALIFDPMQYSEMLKGKVSMAVWWFYYGVFTIGFMTIASVGILIRWILDDKLGYRDSSVLHKLNFKREV